MSPELRPRCAGSTSARCFRVTNFGESHGPAIGCVVDGCPPGMALSEADIQPELDRRRPGTSRHVTQRKEADKVEILSGVFEGRTTGTPIAPPDPEHRPAQQGLREPARHLPPRPRRLHLPAQVRPARPARRRPRIGAADRADGRRRGDRAQVAARAAAARRFAGHMTQIGDDRDPVRGRWSTCRTTRSSPPTRATSPRLEAYIDELRKDGDSCGARIDVVARNVPGRPRRAALRQARRRHRPRDDGHQRRQGRRDRRRLRRRRAARHDARRRAHARGLRSATTPAACSAASRPARTSPSRSRSSRPARSAARAARSTSQGKADDRSRRSAATTPASASAPRRSPRRCSRWC